MSADGSRVAYQEAGRGVYQIQINGSTAPQRIDSIPPGADALSAPSPEGLVAYAGGGTGAATVCFVGGIPKEAMP
jgi:hypothetical protein